MRDPLSGRRPDAGRRRPVEIDDEAVGVGAGGPDAIAVIGRGAAGVGRDLSLAGRIRDVVAARLSPGLAPEERRMTKVRSATLETGDPADAPALQRTPAAQPDPDEDEPA